MGNTRIRIYLSVVIMKSRAALEGGKSKGDSCPSPCLYLCFTLAAPLPRKNFDDDKDNHAKV